MLIEHNVGLWTRVWQRFVETDRSMHTTPSDVLIYGRNIRVPGSPTEIVVLELLADGPRSFADMIEQITEQLMREEISTGSWAADVAVWGPALFQREATALLEQLDGDLIAIVPSNSVCPFARLELGAA